MYGPPQPWFKSPFKPYDICAFWKLDGHAVLELPPATTCKCRIGSDIPEQSVPTSSFGVVVPSSVIDDWSAIMWTYVWRSILSVIVVPPLSIVEVTERPHGKTHVDKSFTVYAPPLRLIWTDFDDWLWLIFDTWMWSRFGWLGSLNAASMTCPSFVVTCLAGPIPTLWWIKRSTAGYVLGFSHPSL